MNITERTTVLELIEQVRALDLSGGRKDSIFFQRFNLNGRESTVAVGTGGAGRLIEQVMTRILRERGEKPDPRSGPGVPTLPWEDHL